MRIRFFLSVLLGTTILSPSFAMEKDEFDKGSSSPQKLESTNTQNEPERENAGYLGTLPHDIFNHIKQYLSINDIRNMANTSEYNNKRAQEFLNRHAAAFLIQETKKLRLLEFLWSHEEYRQIKPKGSIVVPKNIKFMQKIYSHLKNGYPLNYLNSVAASHLPWLGHPQGAYFEPFQIILSYAPQLFPYSGTSDRRSTKVTIPAHMNNPELETYCKIIGNYYTQLDLNNMSRSVCAEFINIMLGLKPEQIETRISAIQPHLEFINGIPSARGKNRFIAGLLGKAEPDEISACVNILKESSVLNSLEGDENKEMKFLFVSELTAGNPSQMKAFLDHIEEIYKTPPTKYYKKIWQRTAKYFMTLSSEEISSRMKVLKNHAENLSTLTQQHPRNEVSYEKALEALAQISPPMMEAITNHISYFLTENLHHMIETTRLIETLALLGTPKKINILAQSLTTFIPENMKSSSIELIETWFKGTDEQIEAIGENSSFFFTRDMRGIGMHIDIINKLLKGTAGQIKAIAKNAPHLFTENMESYEPGNLIEALLAGTEGKTQLITENASIFFPKSSFLQERINHIYLLMKVTENQIRLIIQKYSSLFTEDMGWHQQRSLTEGLIEDLLENSESKTQLIIENAPLLFSNIKSVHDRRDYMSVLMRGSKDQIKSIIKKYSSLFTSDMEEWERSMIIREEFHKIEEAENENREAPLLETVRKSIFGLWKKAFQK